MSGELPSGVAPPHRPRGGMTDRSNRPDVRNPVLGLPEAIEALQTLDAKQLQALRISLLAIRAHALAKERESYRKRKGPMVSYWMATATYLRHISHAISHVLRGAA